ncbi:MAG: SMC family ATPase [Thermaceae bacterium]|nr:SMC family ATPase [Thermaceae bacterium]
MKPLKLRLEGFGAYQQAQEIHFDDVELFAITGPTGAGKSTILDAITYALYKTTPRIGSKGLGELKHPGAGQARVELTFAVGEQSWRVVRVLGNENQNRLEYLVGPDWRTHPASEKVRELDNQLATILGMDYETFTRAIMLPQGEFNLFLHGKPTERRDTLIKLYGLENLRAMRERVGERLKGLKERLARLQGELDALEGAEEEKVSALREEIEGLKREELERSRQTEAAQKTLRELERRFERFGELESLRRRKASWEAQAEAVAHIAQRLTKAEMAERVWPQLEGLEVAQREAQEARTALIQARAHLEKLQAERAKEQQGFDPQELKTLETQKANLPLLEAQEARLRRYGGTLELQTSDPLLYDEDRLEALREAERNLKELKKAHSRLERAKTASVQAGEDVTQAQGHIAQLEAQMQHLTELGKAARGEVSETREALASERTRQGILAHRHVLKPGEVCPLCEQTVQVLPPETILTDLMVLEEAARQAENRMAQIEADYKAAQSQLRQAKESLPKRQSRLQERQKEEQGASDEVEGLRRLLEGFGSYEEVSQESLRRLGGLAKALRGVVGQSSVRDYSDGLHKRLARLSEQAEKITRLESQIAEREGKLRASQEVSRERERRAEGLGEALVLLLQQTGFDHPESVKQARLSQAEAQALKKRQHEHQQEGSLVVQQLAKLEAELGSQDPVTDSAVREQKAGWESLEASLDTIKKQIGGRQADFQRLQEQIVRKREALKQKATLDRETDLWEQLSSDLKGDRFQDFLLRHYQSGLLGRASELIKELSQGRYFLRLEDDEYKVLDRWTDTLRPVRTLSGGESFMASLSLALSLSEHLSRGRIGALFLDEGFGTLDAETLDQVAGVLEALPTQGRLVGIVTHVEALAERLPARLMVEKSPAGSKVSWRE